MATFQNQNQFAQTPVLGQVDLTGFGNNVFPAKINPASVGLLQVGQAFKIVDVAGSEIIVDVAAIGEMAIGVLIYNPKKSVYVAGDTVDLAGAGTVVYLEASAAVARGANVQQDPTAVTVATRTSTNFRLGKMLDKPTAAATLCRVLIQPASDTGTI